MNKSKQLSGWWEESRQGNVESFSHIHRELYTVLYHYLLKIFRDENTSQDILQDVFVKLWERKESIGAISNVRVYFFKSARSLALNYIKFQKKHLISFTDEPEFDMVFSHEEILVNNENSKETSRILSLALNALPKRQREMIFLKYFDGCNYEEIAEVTGIKYQSVINHVHRGIIQLRNELAEGKKFQVCRMAV